MKKLLVVASILLCTCKGWCPPPSNPSFPLAFFPLSGNQNNCDPTQISGMVGWYAADDITSGVGSPVTSWPDRSPNGNNLTNLVGSSSQPTLLQSNAVLAAHSAVTFDGTDDFLVRTGPAGFSGESGQTLVAVTQYTSGVTGFGIVCTTSNGLNELRLNAGGDNTTCIMGGGNVTVIANSRLSTNGWYIVRFDNTSNLEQMFENPGVAGSQTDQTETGNFSSNIIRLGTRTNGSLPWAGKLAELIIYNRSITDGEKTSLYCYLKGKYGF